MKREDVLMEALPYIQKFQGRSVVIKWVVMPWLIRGSWTP